MPGWYVVAREPEEGDYHVYVFGPFKSETDARAYALDFAQQEEGLAEIEAVQITHEEATILATDRVLWPYKDNG